MYRNTKLALCATTLWLLAPVATALAQVAVVTQHNDAGRTGANTAETILTTGNVNVSQFGKLFERTVDDQIYAQPLYVPAVNIANIGVRDVVYVATVNNSVYAFDADDPAATAPLWRIRYSSPPSVVPVSKTDVGQACGTYNDFSGNIGIVGTPVIDPVAQTMYLVARTKESGSFVQRLHAINITDGTERHAPVVIQASVVGTGDGRDAQNNITFNARTENQRAGLLLDHGVVYIAWASHCDQGPYHGWILGYNAQTLGRVFVYNTTPNGGLGGIWMSGGGLSADAAGNIYAITGNGSFTGATGGSEFGNSFIKVSPTGLLLDWFTPYNWSFLNATDEDLGIQSAVHIPGTTLMVGGGKDGVLYVINRTNMGHSHTSDNNQVVQSFQASGAQRMNGTPAFWNGPGYGAAIYLMPAAGPLKVFRLVNGLFQTTAAAQSTVQAPAGMPGGMLSISSSGNTAGTGIVWAAMSRSGDANQATVPGILRAFNASNVTLELWNSQTNATRDSLGNFSKFSSPTVADGKVYVPTFSNKLVVYGLLGTGGTGNTPPVVNAGIDQTLTLPATTTLTGTAVDDGNPNPPGSLTTTWSLVSGPAAITLATPGAVTTGASFPVPGVYTVRLSAFDGAVTSSDDVVVTVNPGAGSGTGLLAQYFNDAGNSVYMTSLALTRVDPIVNFDWAGAAPDPAVQANNFSVHWSGQIQPPVTATYTLTTTADDGVRLWINGQLLIDNWVVQSATSKSVNVSFAAGTRYDVRMDYFVQTQPATAKLLWSYPGQTQVPIPQFALYPAALINQPPTVNAGSDKTITLPATALLQGSASDDGLPTPPGQLAFSWVKVSGREDSSGGTVVFSNPNALTTTATFGADGVYVLRLTVNDGAVSVSDDVTVTVNPAAVGQGSGLLGQYFKDPGTGSHFVTPVMFRLDGTVNFDWANAAPATGVPADNFAVRWTGQVKPLVTGNHTFSTIADDGVRLWINGKLVIDNWVDQSATTKSSSAIALTAGTLYDVKMEYYDHTSLATAKLLWAYSGQSQTIIPQQQLYPASPPANAAPAVGGGSNQTITFGHSATLAGTATDDGLPLGSAVTVTWSQVSGPGTAMFTNPNAAQTTATFSAVGIYVLRVTASDGALAASADVTITVNVAPPPTANGLTAQYFNDSGNGTHLVTAVLTRIDSTVNFTWSGAPATGVTADNFSVRWTGQVQAPVSGTYRFITTFNDGVRLWVNGQQVINNWTDHSSTTMNTSNAIALTAGVKYTITMEFYEHTGSAVARLQWSYPGQSTQVIPNSRLFQ